MARKPSGRKNRTQHEAARATPRAESSTTVQPPTGDTSVSQARTRAVRSRPWLFALAALLILVAAFFSLKLSGFLGAGGVRGPIILVSIDTLRADRLPTYGYGKIQTPAIDELAGNGIVFDNCYTHVPLTLPAHTSLFTGLLPSEHGVRDNIGFKVASGAKTLATELKRAGYATGGAVSAYVLHSTTGISQGFDWYDDQFERAATGTVLTDVRRDGMETLNRAVGWLEERSQAEGAAKRPVFLFLHLYEPHAPYKPPERFLAGDTAPYDGAVMYSDEIVGRFLAELRKLGLYDPSLIILLSDHGEGLDEHGELTHGVFLYREVMHVPLIIKLPGGQNGGRRIQAPVQLIDIAPTVFEWAGIQPDPKLLGHTLGPALHAHEFQGDRSIVAESLYGRLHFGWSELFSLTNSRYNLILAPREELYDIREDPEEVHNLLAGDSPGTSAKAQLPRPLAVEYAKLHQELKAYVREKGLVAPKAIDPVQLKKLRALGYLGSQAPDSGENHEAPDPKDRIGDLANYQLAMRMKTIYKFSKVAAILEDVVKTSPGMVDAWDELSETYRRLGRLDRAVDALRQDLEVAPQRAPQRFELVDALVQLKRFDEARKELEVAKAYRPDEAEIRLAYLEIAAGRPDAAREAAARAAQGLPAADPFIKGVLSYGRQEFSHAVPLFRQALDELDGRSSDTLPYVHFYLGDALARESSTVQDKASRTHLLRDAEQQLRTELSLRPTNSSAVMSLCFVHSLADDGQKIDEDLGEFAKENPSAVTYRFIANLYRSMNANRRASQWSERARRSLTDPGSAP
jgi:choline-sulfatase